MTRRLPRIWLPPEALRGDSLEIQGAEARHLARVLRARPGDRFAAFDGSGIEVVAEVLETGPALRGRILARHCPRVEPRLELTLYLSLVRGERFDLAVEKATELGVSRLVPLGSRRCTVRRPGPGRRQRWERIARSAAAQSGRVRVPRIGEPLAFPAALEEAVRGHRHTLILAPGAPPPEGPLADSAALLVGPEGGFEEQEVGTARAAGALVVGLGPRTLRSETAAVVAVALALYLAGEIRCRSW